MYARYGIPIAFFTTGNHRDYHQVTDEPEYIDYDKLASCRSSCMTREDGANLDHRVVVDNRSLTRTGIACSNWWWVLGPSAGRQGSGSSRTRIAILNAPRGYRATLGSLRLGRGGSAARGTFPSFQFFTRSRSLLETKLGMLLGALEPDGRCGSRGQEGLRRPTDMTEDVVRAVALPTGLVDVKVAAVDEGWSGLKLVRRLRNR